MLSLTIAAYCSPLSLANGMITFSNTTNAEGNYPSGTTATQQCDPGYSLAGSESRTCNVDIGTGQFDWNGIATTCERKQ